jgi:hypothetical protein
MPEEAIHHLKEKLLKATLSNSDNILGQHPLPSLNPVPLRARSRRRRNSFVLELSTLSAPP